VFVGVISLGGSLCYAGPCSSSLALICVIWVVKVFRVFGGCVSRCDEPFPLICCLQHRLSCLLSYILCAGFLWADHFCFEIGSQCLAAILSGLTWCFSGVPGVKGALLIWSYSLVGRSLLIRDRESVLWLKLVFGLVLVFFRWIGGRKVVEAV
jgi:hypothetical protein